MGEIAISRLDVFLNPAANRGRAGANWAAVEAALQAGGRDVKCWRAGSRDEMLRHIGEAIGQGAIELVAAGGDGTFQTLLDGVMLTATAGQSAAGDVSRLRLGAIAMGTSNDLHKPLDLARKVGPGVPCRLDGATAAPHDVIRLEAVLPDGKTETHHLVQSSSVGTIPTANLMLTKGNGLAAWLYKIHYTLALHTTSTWVVCTYPGFRGEVTAGTEKLSGLYSGMTVLKRKFIAGAFEFATKRTVSDGLFDLGLCQKVGAMQMVGLIAAFGEKGFGGLEKVAFRELAELSASFAEPQAIDYDGEVLVAKSATWRVLPKALTLMG